MKNAVLGLLVGLAIGLAFAFGNFGDDYNTDTRNNLLDTEIVRDMPTPEPMSDQEAETHRGSRFESISTMDEIMRLPSDFDQDQALYILAGRESVEGVIKLIHQASRIADRSDRQGCYSVLFSRLANIDPLVAVELAGQSQFAADNSFEYGFWRSWARSDLEAALEAAVKLTPRSRKEDAVQAMYRAHGVANSPETDRIKEVLGIGPNRWARFVYIQSLADESPATAIDFINDTISINDQNYLADNLGHYLAMTKPQSAHGYANLIKADQARKRYTSQIKRSIAVNDPAQAVEQWLVDQRQRGNDDSFKTALYQLAQDDYDSALAAWERIEDSKIKLATVNSLIEIMARDDIAETLKWAQDQEAYGLEGVLMKSAKRLSNIDPKTTLNSLYIINDLATRQSIDASISASLVTTDPEFAFARILALPTSKTRDSSLSSSLQYWAKFDPVASLEFIVKNELALGKNVIMQMSYKMPNIDPKLAMSYVGRLDSKNVGGWINSIARTVANSKDAQKIEEFMENFRHYESFPTIQGVLLNQLASISPERTLMIAERLPAGKNRESVFTEFIFTNANANPVVAAQLLDELKTPGSREFAVSQIAAAWAKKDDTSALNWINSLARSSERDAALRGLIFSTRDSFDQLSLVKEIKNPRIKRQTTLTSLYNIAENEPKKALELASDLGLSDEDLTRFNLSVQECYIDVEDRRSRPSYCYRNGNHH